MTADLPFDRTPDFMVETARTPGYSNAMTVTESPDTAGGAALRYPPTRQQQAILDAVRTGQDVTVRALAGTGKTTTLVMLAETLLVERPDAKIVYLAFNKSVQVEAAGKFPSNVEARTADSVAWKHPANALLITRSHQSSTLTPDYLIREFGIKDIEQGSGGRKWMVAGAAKVLRLARKTVDNFCITADTEITERHLARLDKKDERHSHRLNPAVLALAKRIWFDILDPEGIFPVTNSHVTKNWALQHPDLSVEGSGLSRPVDVIFFDEAQDVNEVLGDVVARQTIQKIVVGDGNQAIYGWRGAVDYLDKVDADHDLPLTTSFRFGPEIAAVGNMFLSRLGSPWTVEGAGAAGTVNWVAPEETIAPDAIIARTNAGAIRAIMEQMANGRTVKVQARYADELKRLIATAEWLMSGGAWKDRPKQTHEDLVEFKNWREVAEAAGSDEGHYAKVRMLHKLVTENGIPRLRGVIDATVTSENAEFDVAVMTAHAAKGLEWDSVAIYDDFWKPVFKRDGKFYLISEEARLAYVAVTRARRRLTVVNGGLDWVLYAKPMGLDADLDDRN